MSDDRHDDFVKFTHKDRIQFIKGQIDSMIGHPALRKVICPDPLASITRADLTLPVGGNLVMLLLLHLVEQPGTKDF